MNSSPKEPAADLDIEGRLRELADKDAIRTLVATYAQYMAVGQADKVPALFTEDARLTTSKTLVGKAEITAFYSTGRSGAAFP